MATFRANAEYLPEYSCQDTTVTSTNAVPFYYDGSTVSSLPSTERGAYCQAFYPVGSLVTNPANGVITSINAYGGYHSTLGCYITGTKVTLGDTKTCPIDTELNLNDCSCTEPPPTCPDGQINVSDDVEVLECECDNGYPMIYDVNTSTYNCQTPTCPPNSPQQGLPLKYEGVTMDTCTKLFNGVLGFSSEWISSGDLSCCYSDSAKIEDDPCPTNHILSGSGECVEIPISEECPRGSYWSIIEKSCVEWFPESNTTNDQSGSNDGKNSDGTTRDSNNSDYYSGGGYENNLSDFVTMEFNEDEVNDMLSDYSDEVKSEFDDFISEYTSELLTLHEIRVPTIESCGCTDPSYDFSVMGSSYSGTMPICGNMETLMGYTKPVLWFVFLVTTLFMFFRGN